MSLTEKGLTAVLWKLNFLIKPKVYIYWYSFSLNNFKIGNSLLKSDPRTDNSYH